MKTILEFRDGHVDTIEGMYPIIDTLNDEVYLASYTNDDTDGNDVSLTDIRRVVFEVE